MRKSLTFLLAVLVMIPVSGQYLQVKSPELLEGVQRPSLAKLPAAEPHQNQPPAQAPVNTVPIGTVVQDAVTAIKIGEASNAFTFLSILSNQLGTIPSLNALSFIYRHNIGECGGQTIDNGRFRYSISTDGGNTWNVGSAGSSSAGTTPTGCYGIGELNPSYLQASRYPNGVLSLPPGGSTIDDAVLVYSGPTLGPTYPDPSATWDGAIAGVVSDVNNVSAVVEQEAYLYQNGSQYFSWSTVERVPGEYWYTSLSWDGANVGSDIFLNKGVLDTATNQISWSVAATITPASSSIGAPNIAFSPDGQVGYLAFTYDGNDDDLFSPGFSTSNDGGLTWSDPEEIEMTEFPELKQLLSERLFLVQTDSFTRGGGDATLGTGNLGVVVDSAYNAHIIAMVCNASRYDSSANGDSLTAAGSGFIFPVFGMFMYDFTRDEFGDWNMMYLGDVNTLEGTYGDPTEENTARNWIRASRSAAGDVIFASWTDTDTVGNQTLDNDFPDLLGISYDVSTQKLTTLRNWTIDDNLWASRALYPKVAPVALSDNNGIHTVPTVIMDIGTPDASFLNPVSFWYFSNVSYDQGNDYTEDPQFFYNCKQNPFTNTTSITDANCGQADGIATVVASGGIAPYTYQWDAAASNSTTASASNLAAGIYSVVVTDSVGCIDFLQVTVNNVAAQVATIDSTSDISCNGFGNGYASVTVPDPGAVASYSWSNGQTGTFADSLPAGTSTLIVTDTVGCESFATVEITEPRAISLFASNVDVLCFGETTASATALASGGTGTLSYAWDNGATTPIITGLGAGNYSVTVTDENGCTQAAAVTVNQPDSLALTLTVTKQNNKYEPPYEGELFVSFTGGTGQPSFSWTGPNGYTASGTNFIFGLNGGTYIVTATDENGCVTVDSVFLDQAVADGIEDELAAGISKMEIYPNPTSGTFTVNLELVSRDDVDIEVININGQTLAARHTDKVMLYKEEFNIDHLPAGIYMVKVRTSKGEATQRLMVR